MADESTTSTEVAAENLATGITDQATLDQAIAEETAKLQPEKKEEPVTPIVEVKEEKVETKDPDRYSALRKDYDKLASELKAFKAKEKLAETKSKLADMDYDQKIDFLLENQHKVEPEEPTTTEPVSDTSIDEFITSDKDLKSLGPEIQKMFRALATSDDYVDSTLSGGQKIKWKEVKLEDIKQAYFQPMLDKLAGTRVTIKVRPLKGQASIPDEGFTPARIAKMSPKEYEKNREKILRSMGTNI